jgi:hypothetical protein
MIQPTKRWTLAGLIILLGAFFANPDACVRSRDILHWISPDSHTDLIAHIGTVLGIVLAVLGKSLAEKNNVGPK